MRKYLLLIVTIFFAFNIHGQNLISADKSSDGQTLNLDNDKVLEIKLPCNPSTGYIWNIASINKEVLTQTGVWEFIPNENNGMPGQAGTQVIRLIGVSEGSSELKLEYKRPWENSIPALDNFKLNLISNDKYFGNYNPSVKPQSFVPHNSDKSYHSDKYLKSNKSLPMPASFSWESQCTPVKNQADCGSCWAFASTGEFEAIINITDKNIRSLSEQFLINCDTGAYGCQGGWSANNLWVSPGAVYDNDLPYSDSTCLSLNGSTARCINTCGIYNYHEKADSSIYINTISPSIDEIKQDIYNYGPVWVCVDAWNNFIHYKGGIFTTDEGSNTDHAVVLVGWKDSLLSNGSTGYWILRNSWGPTWGEHGYMRIGYGVGGVGAVTSYIVYKGGIPSCTGTPNPGSTQSTLNPVCSSTVFTLSMQNFTYGKGETYQWQSSPDNSIWSNMTDDSQNPTINCQQSTDTWYRCDATCSTSTSSATSTPLQVKINNNPFNCYCLGSYYSCGSKNGIDITNVTFGSINDNTTAYCNLPYNYNDYTGLSTTATQGQSYPISITSDDTLGHPVYWGIWVDWNNSGSFIDNPNKYTVINNNGSSTTGKGTVVVPVDATTGNHRMRIRANAASDPGQLDACSYLLQGEQEDYTVNVIASSQCAGTPEPGNTLSSANPVCSSASFTLSFQNAISGSEVKYQWQSSPDNSKWLNMKGDTNNICVLSQTDTTWYRCIVKCAASTNSATSTPLKVKINNDPSNCYCLGSYISCGNIYGIDITNVKFGDINNTTKSDCNLPYSYSSFTGLSATVKQGLLYPISISSDDATYEYPVYWGIWIDWNNSGSFTDNANKYNVITNNGMVLGGTGTITVPMDATTGNHRMRIRANYASDPGQNSVCANLMYGEQEDYTINVIPKNAGINELGLGLGINIYPNPVSNELTVETSSNYTFSLILTNIIGQTIFQSVINQKTVINMNNLATGIYLIRISNDKEIVVKKILKL